MPDDAYIAEGHGRRPDGTFDPGASDGIHSEQRDSKPVAEACTRVLRNAGLEVVSESEMADDPNFYGTTAAANEAGVKCVVSFHYDWNQAPPGAFAIATSDDGRELGWAIETRVADAGFDIRDYPDDRDDLYLLNNTEMPAVIFECGRIGHEDIDDPDEQRRLGEAAAAGILDWMGVSMGHPYDGHKAFRQDHDIGSIPNWSPWEKYVDAGGTSVPESGTWAFTRADMAWVWDKFIRPLAARNAALEKRVAALESKIDGLTGQVEIDTEKVSVVKSIRVI